MAEARRLGAMGDQAGMLELMQQSAFMGNYDALYELARIYQNGSGVPKDMTLAIAYLTTADGRGHLESTRVLAWNYLLGNGVPIDRDYSIMLFEKAQAGSARALREYGMLLTNQLKPGLNDPDKGIALLSRAMASGDGEAAFKLSEALESRGRTAEAATAKATALSAGYQALAAPAKLKATQLGARADLKAEEVKMKALGGDTDSIFTYANGVLLGKYPSIDGDFEAYCWFTVASDRGHRQAKSEIAALQGVRTHSDAKAPGKLDQCVADVHQAIAH